MTCDLVINYKEKIILIVTPLILNFQVQPNSTFKDVSHYLTFTMSLSEIMAFKKNNFLPYQTLNQIF